MSFKNNKNNMNNKNTINIMRRKCNIINTIIKLY